VSGEGGDAGALAVPTQSIPPAAHPLGVEQARKEGDVIRAPRAELGGQDHLVAQSAHGAAEQRLDVPEPLPGLVGSRAVDCIGPPDTYQVSGGPIPWSGQRNGA
jgi:hypothetical protein